MDHATKVLWAVRFDCDESLDGITGGSVCCSDRVGH